MLVVCSYCRRVYAEKKPLESKDLSHGICPACWDYYMPQVLDMSLSEHLDSYDSPVIMVDEVGRVIGVNVAMTSFLKTTREASLGLLGGELLQCRNAYLPAGCGKTVHCATCTLRQTFTEARVSQSDRLNIPAFVDCHDHRLHFLISAFSRENFVKVVIDKVTGVEPAENGYIHLPLQCRG